MSTGRVPTTANSPLTAKGDLFTYDTNQARLAVGSNGDTLLADSASSVGLRWNPTGSVNYLINGLFDIWQRGTSSTTSGNYATADRWAQGMWSGTGTWAQTTAALATGTQYSIRFTASATAQPYLAQAIETQNAQLMAGRQVTLSAFLATSDSSQVNLTLSSNTSTDAAWNGTYTNLTPDYGTVAQSTTSTLTRYSVTYTVPANAKTLRVFIDSVSTIPNAATLTIGGVQLELGGTATAIRRAGGTIAGELAACQRYYWRSDTTVSNGALSVFGACFDGTQAFVNQPLPVTMRIAPSTLDYSAVGFTSIATAFGTGGTLTISEASTRTMVTLKYVHGSSIFTAKIPGNLYSGTGATGYFGISAEL